MTKSPASRLKTLLLCAGLLIGQGASANTIQITANLTGTNTWRNTNEYVLNGFIYVLTNSVLIFRPPGFSAEAPSAQGLIPKTAARLIPPKPMPVRSKNWRRVKMISSAEGECSRMYFSVV